MKRKASITMEGNSSACSMRTRSSSSKDKKMKMRDATDRISDLPEPILDYILSFLDMKEVVQTRLVSRRWRNLWISLPILNFNHSLWNKTKTLFTRYRDESGTIYGGYTCWKHEFMDFVDQVLLLREGSNICKFHLVGDYYCDEDRIGKWIIALVKQQAQEVHINIRSQKSPEGLPRLQNFYELPHCLFISTIKLFKLQVDTNNLGLTFHLPNSMCSAANLKSLHLVSAKLPEGDSNGELVLRCPMLENLIIVECDYLHLDILNISALQLQNLVLGNELLHRNDSCKIKIVTPNLISFQCKGGFKDYCLENLSCLNFAEILSLVHEELQAKSLIKLLTGLRNATTLELSGWWDFKTTFGSRDLFNQLPHSYHNLKSLKLERFNSPCIDLVANLLKRSPHIETLLLEFPEDERKENWGVELSFHCIFYRLKSIEMKNLEGDENELKLLEFLLRNAIVLETVRVTASLKGEDLAEFRMKLQALPRASSKVRILVL